MAGREIRCVSVIGTGLMGRSIAALHLARGIPVTVADVSREVAIAAGKRILDEVRFHAAGSLPPVPRAVAAGLLRIAESDVETARADLLIESLPENPRIKQRVFSRLGPLLDDDAIVATNTSSLSVSAIARSLPCPERVCGLHFCHPVAERPLIEVVRADQTNDETLDRVARLARRLGKRSLVVADRPGFLVNRLLWPFLNEGLELLRDGVEAAAIELAAREFGLPWGPLAQLDAIGIDVALRVGAALRKAYPDRVGESQLLVDLYEARRFGAKCGAGILCNSSQRVETTSQCFEASGGCKPPGSSGYSKSTGRRRGIDGTLPPAVREIVARHSRPRRSVRPADITWRLVLPMLVEAVRILDEQVASADDIDAAVVDGLKFFEPYGGVLRWADSIGFAAIVSRLREFERFGNRFVPPASLVEMAKTGRRFHPDEARRAA